MTGPWAPAATGATGMAPPEDPGSSLGALVEVGLDMMNVLTCSDSVAKASAFSRLLFREGALGLEP